MAFRNCVVGREMNTLSDGDVVFTALLCELDSCLGPTVRTVWCTPEHEEACANNQVSRSRRAFIDVNNVDAMSRVAQRALMAHMLDTKLLPHLDSGIDSGKRPQNGAYLVKTYLVPLRSSFDLFPASDVTDIDSHLNFSSDPLLESEADCVAMCVFVFRIRGGNDLCGLLVFFDLHRAFDSNTNSPVNFLCKLHVASYPDSTKSTAGGSFKTFTETQMRTLLRADWLRNSASLLTSCFELKLHALEQCKSITECVAPLGAFLSGFCAVYSHCSFDAVAQAEKEAGATVGRDNEVCHCSFVSCLLRTVTTSDRKFLVAALAAHLATRRSVVIGTNFDAVYAVVRFLDTVIRAEDCSSRNNCVSSQVDRVGGVWRTSLVRPGVQRGLLSSLPEGAALLSLQGVVPLDGLSDPNMFAADSLQVDNDFLFANSRPLSVIFVHVRDGPVRLTGSVHRFRELQPIFQQRRDVYLNPTVRHRDRSVENCALRAVYISPMFKTIDTQSEVFNSSVLVEALFSSFLMLAERVNPHATTARSCVDECLLAFWTDLGCRTHALRKLRDWKPAALRNMMNTQEAVGRLQTALSNLLDIRSEIDFHVLCTYLLNKERDGSASAPSVA